MKGLKNALKNSAIIKAQQFLQDKNYVYAIEASVYKGAYYGLGGVKIIPLPEFCSVITNAVGVICKAKSKFKDIPNKDIKVLYNCLANKFNGLEISIEGNTIRIYSRETGEGLQIAENTKLCNDTLKMIVLYIIKCTSKHKFNNEDIKVIYSALNNCIEMLSNN